MNMFLNLLLYRHRRFKDETYFKDRFILMLIISAFVAVLIADTLNDFLITMGVLMIIDMLLALGAWIYYKIDL
jgi:hypothetical protein